MPGAAGTDRRGGPRLKRHRCGLRGPRKPLRVMIIFLQEVFLAQTVWLTLVKGRGARSELPDGIIRNPSLFSWFRACMFIFRGNSRTFRVAAVDAYGFFVVILVLFVGLRCSSKGPTRVSRGNSPIFSALQLLRC